MTAQIWIALATANFLAGLAPGQNVALMGAAVARSGPAGGGFAMLGILWAEIAWAALAIHLTFGARELAGDTYFLLQIASAGVLIWFGFGALRERGPNRCDQAAPWYCWPCWRRCVRRFC
ncbi:hypothetical protein [uncultured Sulfitobacter sp.]|uniref:hypothetical protein n=1 Tax=uncultured Sulfitobacter sp. TaxID=191468 RepID=UPI00262A77AE|nr:hypothetical protein [uncultured Sulfitobacter sp.]